MNSAGYLIGIIWVLVSSSYDRHFSSLFSKISMSSTSQDCTTLCVAWCALEPTVLPQWLILVKYCLQSLHFPPVAIFMAHFLQASKHLHGTGLYSISTDLQKKQADSPIISPIVFFCGASSSFSTDLFPNIMNRTFEGIDGRKTSWGSQEALPQEILRKLSRKLALLSNNSAASLRTYS